MCLGLATGCKRMTVADGIRKMNDDELAKLLEGVASGNIRIKDDVKAQLQKEVDFLWQG